MLLCLFDFPEKDLSAYIKLGQRQVFIKSSLLFKRYEKAPRLSHIWVVDNGYIHSQATTV